MNKRIFVKKKEQYTQESKDLLHSLNSNYNLNLIKLDEYIIYDIYNIESNTYEKS